MTRWVTNRPPTNTISILLQTVQFIRELVRWIAIRRSIIVDVAGAPCRNSASSVNFPIHSRTSEPRCREMWIEARFFCWTATKRFVSPLVSFVDNIEKLNPDTFRNLSGCTFLRWIAAKADYRLKYTPMKTNSLSLAFVMVSLLPERKRFLTKQDRL